MRTQSLKARFLGVAIALCVVLATLAVLRGIATAGAPPGQYDFDALAPTLKDTKTGLEWQRIAQPPRKSLANAQTYCQTLALGDVPAGQWRVPNVRELATILDPASTAPPLWDWDAFGDSGPGQLWSNTPDVSGSNGEVWTLDVTAGEVMSAIPASTEGVLCVH
jgi:hypothetical protein